MSALSANTAEQPGAESRAHMPTHHMVRAGDAVEIRLGDEVCCVRGMKHGKAKDHFVLLGAHTQFSIERSSRLSVQVVSIKTPAVTVA